jgi:hypothetical protein
MDTTAAPHEGPQGLRPVSPIGNNRAGGKDRAQRIIRPFKHWVAGHTSEILWAFLFAVTVGYGLALWMEEPKPYKIYVVADSDTDPETLKEFAAEENKGSIARIAGVNVEVKLETLENQDPQTANKKAEKLSGLPDTLLVIEHGRSQHVEDTLHVYFGTRPQVPVISTVATDDNLLTLCDPSCFNEIWFDSLLHSNQPFVPLLQLSPTNEVQGRSAIQFATQKGKRRFLIVTGDDPADQPYASNMAKSYSEAIRASHAELVGIRRMDSLPSEIDFESWKPDCVLYAGGIGEAQTLFNRLSSENVARMDLTITLSDSVVQSRGSDADLAVFSPVKTTLPAPSISAKDQGPVELVTERERMGLSRSQHDIPVNFTYQTDASDYNAHANPYAEDAFQIALQLISDLNDRGGDLTFQMKSALHMHSVKDVRRNLLRIMKENSSSRTWYRSKSGAPYIFEGHKQYGGIFHVWQLKQSPFQPGSEMDDVDNWHPPRLAINVQHDKELARR